jgi:hypothetical protein
LGSPVRFAVFFLFYQLDSAVVVAAVPFFHGRGIFNYDFVSAWCALSCILNVLQGFVPFRRPITTVVGAPIAVPVIERPSQEDIDLWHGQYLKAVRELFAAHKIQSDAEIVFQ